MDSKSKRLTVMLRQEFSFYANDEVLKTILQNIAAGGVTIAAFTITKINMRNVNFARLVVGPDSSNSSQANLVAQDALRSLGVQFDQEKVIQLIGNPGTPGILSNVLQILSHRVEVFATYTGVNSIILNVSDIQTALRLLKKNNIVG
ncbi:hypothetical protein QE429_000753 [Bacillus sp. SORGH_AS 510]|uniref:hypothetical protein n=1 Tax=Bacillus sp. SORGH_AS_0510 TaxID=3041771 RepID=UPI002780BB56|nr:hypothetical protein [Bacillus sp. SORGH_AS_0510]MDQ1143926.1 hypothetical protein [Bacillus sp. SORGH_AS_0510]